MVEEYLQKNVLIFDPEVLKELFKEADFKGEGSLDVRSLSAAISGEARGNNNHMVLNRGVTA